MNFCKMNGAGNDFIIIDNREAGMNESELSALAAAPLQKTYVDRRRWADCCRNGTGKRGFSNAFFNADGSRLKCAATERGVFAGMDMKMDLQAQCSELRLTRELLSARKFRDANTECL